MAEGPASRYGSVGVRGVDTANRHSRRDRWRCAAKGLRSRRVVMSAIRLSMWLYGVQEANRSRSA